MTVHKIAIEDIAPAATMRDAAKAHKGEVFGPDARPMLDEMLAANPAAEGIRVEPGMLGGVSGYWCRPPEARQDSRGLYLPGGGYMLGSAKVFTNFVGQIAARAGADTFVPEYSSHRSIHSRRPSTTPSPCIGRLWTAARNGSLLPETPQVAV